MVAALSLVNVVVGELDKLTEFSGTSKSLHILESDSPFPMLFWPDVELDGWLMPGLESDNAKDMEVGSVGLGVSGTVWSSEEINGN